MVTYGLTQRDVNIAALRMYCGVPYSQVMQELKALYNERKAQVC